MTYFHLLKEFDQLLQEMLVSITGFHIPQEEEGRGVECVLNPPVRGWNNLSFQSWLERFLVRSGGLELRSLSDTCYAALIGSCEMSHRL